MEISMKETLRMGKEKERVILSSFGEIKNNPGIFYFANGDKYEGGFVNGAREGKGKNNF